MSAVQRTPFYDDHAARGGRMVPFAGWDMPVQFTTILEEHRTVREKAGLFDISHMGQLWFTGADARSNLQSLVTNDVAPLPVGRGLYALLCRDDGGVIDDLYIYCLAPTRFLVIVNASRVEADRAWIAPRLTGDVRMASPSSPAALALQGPLAGGAVRPLLPGALELTKNGVGEFSFEGRTMVVARTGYTGEDGFEFFGESDALVPLYKVFVERDGVPPCGLGCRDTLRLEMGYRLYGQDLDEAHSALEAGLGWAVKLDKGDFIGRAALAKAKAEGLRRRFIALRLTDRGVPRHGAPILVGGRPAGEVTSGTFSPSLQVGLAMGYVDAALWPSSGPTGPVAVRLHGRDVPAQSTTLPFYRRQVL
jgi:aminomethyltransferase